MRRILITLPVATVASLLLPLTVGAQLVQPGGITLAAAQQQQFTLDQNGAILPAYWRTHPRGIGTITSSGLYTAPSVITQAMTIEMVALSGANVYSTAVNLVPSTPSASSSTSSGSSSSTAVSASGVSVALSPSSVYLYAGETKSFTHTVTGTTNTSVTWSISPNVGSINLGVYVAPSVVSVASSVTVTARSAADPTQSGTAIVHLQPTQPPSTPSTPSTPALVSIGMSPTSVSLNGGQAQQFVATVSGTTNTAVTWSLVPNVGTISNGLYTAPSLVNTAQTVTVVATSAADSTKSASASIQLQAAAASTNSAFTPIRVSCGNTQYVDPQGLIWSADYGWSGSSSVGSTTLTIAGTTLQGLYQHRRFGKSLQYSFPVPAGSYTVTLKFAETAYAGPGLRVFNVAINNQAVLSNFDIFAQAGGDYIALDKSFTVSTSSSPLNIAFTGIVSNASISGISISQANGVTVTPAPSVGVAVTPTTVSLSGGQSQQFSASITGSSNTAVTWSLSPAVGAITNGLYTAPTSITTKQTIVVTATSVANPAATAQATITLNPPPAPQVSASVTPGQATLQPSQTQQFTVTGGTSSSVNWTISPVVGSITQNGLYTAPTTVSTQQTVTVTAKDSTSLASLGSASITLTPSSNPSSVVTLPVEVFGPGGTTVPVSFSIPSTDNLTGPLQLWLKVHGIKYQTQASVQVNGGAWMPINSSTVTLLGRANNFGGIGGGFSTLTLTMNLPAGAIKSGQNTLTFQFNGTNGISSGFRVLNFNILGSGGIQLIQSSTFTEDDPSTWTAPLNDAADIQAGLTLWQTANLTAPGLGPIKAKCGSCHTQDGRDLKYFNYSNLSIRTRAMFHGLTAQQGDQIASYIRSLNTPAPASARPWNPPYQPGPGMDSRPVSEWAAGAGVDAVLDNDSEMLPYVMPGGSTANWAWNAYMNAREIPIPFQLLDWNRWLPTIHPLDAWGSAFTSSPLNQTYLGIRSRLIPNDPTSYKANALAIQTFGGGAPAFQNVMFATTNWTSPTYVQSVYSVSQWAMVKLWEINQEFGLEAMAPSVFGPQSADRAWDTTEAFASSPTFGKIPRPSPGLDNGTSQVHIYLSYAWYELQLLLNDGNGTAGGTTPIDFGYAISFTNNDFTWGEQVGVSGMLMEWLTKALQSGLTAGGGNPTNPYELTVYPGQVGVWTEIPTSQKITLFNAWVANWLNRYRTLTLQQLSVTHQVWTTVNFSQKSIERDLAEALPQLRFVGVDSSLLNQAVTWASSLWPTYNWTGALNAPCVQGNGGQVTCKVPGQ